MALRIDYALRETAVSLKRNFSLTAASLVTVSVSLLLFGAALLINSGVDNATARWSDGVEFIVFLNPDVTQEQSDAVGRELAEHPDVKEARYFSKEQAYEEFKDLFRNSPSLVENVTPDILPPSYRVVPRTPDAEVIQALSDQFETRPGVLQVQSAIDTIRAMQRITDFLRNFCLGAAILLIIAAVFLILNTIRTAMLARRREIEVMKLVGATNWFIRIPYMLEGMIQGLVGALVASVGLWIGRDLFQDRIRNESDLTLFSNFSVTAGQLRISIIWVLLLGAALGALGSGAAVGRYLDV